MIPCVSYLRVSSKGQVGGDGLPRQRNSIQRWAKAHRHKLDGEFVDAGISGASELEDRAGLTELFERLASNGIQAVLVERADRIARDLMVGEVILEEFRKLGVKVIATDSGTDLTVGNEDPTRTLLRQVLGAIAQWEKTIIVQKLRAARKRSKQRNGRCEGRKPYGHHPHEVPARDRILELHRKPPGRPRRSYAAIARIMQAEGFPTRTGKPWGWSTVRSVVQRKRG